MCVHTHTYSHTLAAGLVIIVSLQVINHNTLSELSQPGSVEKRRSADVEKEGGGSADTQSHHC